MTRGTRVYAEYLLRKKREKDEAARLQKAVDQEVELIKKYLDEEEKFIQVDQTKEKKITEDELKRIEDEFRRKNVETINPLQKIIEDLTGKAKEEQELEQKGVQDIDVGDILDEDEGIKQGLKVGLAQPDHLQQSVRLHQAATVPSQGRRLLRRETDLR